MDARSRQPPGMAKKSKKDRKKARQSERGLRRTIGRMVDKALRRERRKGNG